MENGNRTLKVLDGILGTLGTSLDQVVDEIYIDHQRKDKLMVYIATTPFKDALEVMADDHILVVCGPKRFQNLRKAYFRSYLEICKRASFGSMLYQPWTNN